MRPFKELSQDPAATKKYGNKKELNSTIQHVVDEIILQETEYWKLSVKGETQEYYNTDIEIN